MILFEFVALGTVLLWAVIAIVAISVSEMIDRDSPIAATLTAILFTSVIVWFYDLNPIMFVKEHTLEVVEYAIGYLVVGTGWGMFKWYLWLRKIKQLVEPIQKRLSDKGSSTNDIYYAIRSEMRSKGYGDELPPLASENKSRIIGWMAFWPSSMIWTMINDPVRHAFEYIYNFMGNQLQGVSNRMFANLTFNQKKE